MSADSIFVDFLDSLPEINKNIYLLLEGYKHHLTTCNYLSGEAQSKTMKMISSLYESQINRIIVENRFVSNKLQRGDKSNILDEALDKEFGTWVNKSDESSMD